MGIREVADDDVGTMQANCVVDVASTSKETLLSGTHKQIARFWEDVNLRDVEVLSSDSGNWTLSYGVRSSREWTLMARNGRK